jgi:predicted  nucleic acid-binding Zn-ribbon protein
MPIVTHEDEKILSNLEIEIAKMMKDMSGKEKDIAAAEMKIADMYGDYCRFMGTYVRKMRDLSKQLEILSREERSGITKGEVDKNKAQIAHIDSIIGRKEKYYDKMKDLAVQKKSLLEKRVELAELLITSAKIRKEIVDIGLKIEEAKNKMIPAEKVATVEQRLKDLEREFERSKKDLEKKDEQLEKERAEVNTMWASIKATIDKEME